MSSAEIFFFNGHLSAFRNQSWDPVQKAEAWPGWPYNTTAIGGAVRISTVNRCTGRDFSTHKAAGWLAYWASTSSRREKFERGGESMAGGHRCVRPEEVERVVYAAMLPASVADWARCGSRVDRDGKRMSPDQDAGAHSSVVPEWYALSVAYTNTCLGEEEIATRTRAEGTGQNYRSQSSGWKLASGEKEHLSTGM